MGGGGDDSLIGGVGADTMVGGVGDDRYVVDNVGDISSEAADEGTDHVESSVDYTLGDHLENLTLSGSDSLSGTGNALNNVITGNTGDNTLSGLAGDDSIDGGDDNDTIYGHSGSDTVDGGAGDDYINTRTAPGTGLPDLVSLTRDMSVLCNTRYVR